MSTVEDDLQAELEERFHDLLQHAQAVNDMAATPGWAAVVETANAALIAKGDWILGGRMPSHDEYIRTAAWREGVLWLIGAVNRVNRQVGHARDQLADLRDDTPEGGPY